MLFSKVSRRKVLAGSILIVLLAVVFFVFSNSKAFLPYQKNIPITYESFDFDKSDASRRQFGKLVWKGGLILTSESKYMGGISGLHIVSKGEKIVGVTDSGAWLSAKLLYHNDLLHGVSDVRMGPLLGTDKKPFKAKERVDAEALAEYGEQFLISFERDHRIGIFSKVQGRPGRQVGRIVLPKGSSKMEPNTGIEALRVIQGGTHKGKIILFVEYLEDEAGELRGWLQDGHDYKALSFEERDEFSITDIASLDDGGLIILERRFRYSDGVRMRLRYVKAADVHPERLISGDILLEADTKFVVDNMEGLAVHKNSQGKTILTVISDDNFSKLQKTLIMQFEIPEQVLN